MHCTDVQFRKATRADISPIAQLISESAKALSAGDYSSEQIAGALEGAWGVDTTLIDDRTYWVGATASSPTSPIACGGWSCRNTLFGGDQQEDRNADLLDPRVDAARIRAFFVHPGWSRRGLGSELLRLCEAEALAAGFRQATLVATLPGERLYARHGYIAQQRRIYPLPNGSMIEFVSMARDLTANRTTS